MQPLYSVLGCSDHLLDDIIKLVFNEETLQKRIKQLEDDLVVYKRIFSDTNAEKKQLEERYNQLKHDSDKQKEGFEQQMQVSRIPISVFLPGYSDHLAGIQSCCAS